jgi:imidazolonepropionase-like amidohydrolase
MSMIRIFITFLFLLIFGCSGPTENNSDITYIRAGKLIDVVKEQVLTDQIISVKNERIVSVTYFDSEKSYENLIDWSDYTVLPGLIDGHSHLIGNIQSEDVLAPIKVSAEHDYELGLKNAKKTIDAGFTSVIDLGTYKAYVDIKLRDDINAGLVVGPRMYVSGAYITAPGGGGEVVGLDYGVEIPPEFREGVSANETEVRANVNKLIDHNVDLIKVIATGAVLTVGTKPGEPEFTEAEIRSAVEEASKRGRYVTAHAHGAEGIKMAIRVGVRSIQHGSLADDEAIHMMKENGTWLVADIYNGDYIDEVGTAEGWPEETLRKNRDTTDMQRSAFEKAVKVGVNIAFGTDSGVYPHGDNAKQFAYMIRHGLTPMQAIKSATIWGAMSMSLENDIGSLEAGKFADMIAIKGNPLDDITLLENIQAVIKGGKPVVRN